MLRPLAVMVEQNDMAMGAVQTTRRLLALQVLVALVVAAAALVLADVRAAGSALLGGMINIIATLIFAYRVFSAGPGSTAREIARAFYLGEAVKLLVTVLLFAAVLIWVKVAWLPLFIAYAATMLAFWLVMPFAL